MQLVGRGSLRKRFSVCAASSQAQRRTLLYVSRLGPADGANTHSQRGAAHS